MSWIRSLGSAVKRARNVREFAKGYLVPNAWLKKRILNEGELEGERLQPSEVAAALRQLRNTLEGEAYVLGGKVDYTRLAGSETYTELVRVSRMLHLVEPELLPTDAERIAFFVNLYNVMMIHGVIALDIKESVMEIPAFFGTVCYRIGDHVFTPDDIEHGVLRLNSPHPATRTRPFKADDPRRRYAPSKLDWRIHMSLVCVAESCPPIAFYEAEDLDRQLDMAVANYVAMLEIDEDNEVIQVPTIFGFYKGDFGGEEGIRSILLEHGPQFQREKLERALETGYSWNYPTYNWTLNAQ